MKKKTELDLDYVEPRATLVVEADKSRFYASLCENAASSEFVRLISRGALSVDMTDGGDGEFYGALGEGIDVEFAPTELLAGDIAVKSDNTLCFCYTETTGDYAKVAQIRYIDTNRLSPLFKNSFTLKFWLEWSE